VGVEGVILRALEKDRARRFGTASELVAALQAVLYPLQVDEKAPQRDTPRARVPAWLLVSGGALLALLVILGLILSADVQPSTSPPTEVTFVTAPGIAVTEERTQMPSQTAIASPTPSHTPTSAPTPSLTPTPIPTSTLTSTPSATPIPTPSLRPVVELEPEAVVQLQKLGFLPADWDSGDAADREAEILTAVHCIEGQASDLEVHYHWPGQLHRASFHLDSSDDGRYLVNILLGTHEQPPDEASLEGEVPATVCGTGSPEGSELQADVVLLQPTGAEPVFWLQPRKDREALWLEGGWEDLQRLWCPGLQLDEKEMESLLDWKDWWLGPESILVPAQWDSGSPGCKMGFVPVRLDNLGPAIFRWNGQYYSHILKLVEGE
jgi:hypothetical protein